MQSVKEGRSNQWERRVIIIHILSAVHGGYCPPAKVQRFSHLVIKSLATHTHVHMTLGLGMDRLGLYWPGLRTWNIPLVAMPARGQSILGCV